MENLIRIKLNPRRGGPDSIDFIRPCFCLADWPTGEVEIWTSEDGVSWARLDEAEYRASYDPSHGKLYVTLLFDIESVLYLAFFPGGGNIVNVGYGLAKYDRIGLGWVVENTMVSQIPGGCSFGMTDAGNVQAGYAVEGVLAENCGVGYRLKFPEVACFPVGGWIAAPRDADVSIGFGTGFCDGSHVVVGASIMGLCQIGGEIIPLDENTSGCLCAEAAWRKQKQVQLNGVTPKELD